MNTSKAELIAKDLENFIKHCKRNENFWNMISENGIKRVNDHFNWKSYSQRMINLAKLYGFWRYAVSGKGMVELDRYCDLIYHFLLKEKSQNLELSGSFRCQSDDAATTRPKSERFYLAKKNIR